MCGINAIFAYSAAAPPVDPRELLVCREAMRFRGPDAADSWLSDDGRAGLGHRRLAIIDLSPGGAQPMQRDGNVITFNGEIYNYEELRADLQKRGVPFTSHSDTEVLLKLYELEGEAMLPKLRGMFAFAIWDSKRRRMFMARDPYGIKPLYYADDGQTVPHRVAGEGAHGRRARVEAVRSCRRSRLLSARHRSGAVHDVPRDPRAAGRLLLLDRSTRRFGAGSVFLDRSDVARCGRAQRAVHRWSSGSTSFMTRCSSPCATTWWPTCRSAHFCRRESTPAPSSRSRARAARADLQTMTLRFAEYRGRDNDEAPLAQVVARRYGVRHTIQELSREEFLACMPRVFEAMDQPSVDGLNSYFISKAAHEMGLKVAMSGAGGDELFGGYTSFRDIPRWMPITSAPRAHPSPRQRRALAQLRAGEAQPPHQPEDGRDRALRRVIRRRVLREARPLPHLGARRNPRHRGRARRSEAAGHAARHRADRHARSRQRRSRAWPRSSRRSTCAIRFCATWTGRAWRIRSKCACRSSTRIC